MGAINCTGFEALTVSNSAVGLTVPSGTHKALIVCESAGVRCREDGTDPTATTGALIRDGDVVEYMDSNWESTLNTVRFIRDGGTDATLNVHYYD